MKYKIISFFFAILIIQSCNEFLDIKPKGVSIPSKATEYEQLLNYAQMTKGLESYTGFITDDAWLPKDGYGGYENAEQSDKNIYTFESEVFGPAEWDIVWLQSYNRIYYCNVVINQVMKSEGDLAYKQRVKADALVLRAFDYLGLVNIYAKHYDPATASTDLGVPLQLDENITDAKISRATVHQIYDQIFKDLEEAVKYLPDNNLFPYRGSKPFAQAMLARMHLYMGNYDLALSNAIEVLKTHNELLDLKLHSVVSPDKLSGRTDIPDAELNPENINIRFSPYVYGLSGTVFGSEDLLNIYSDNDMRLQLYFTKKVGNNIVDHLMWAPYTPMNVSSSTPEMYLIAAECYARKNDKENALLKLNTLMDKRIRDFTPLTAIDAEDALRKVLEERRREFAFNGIYRLVDLKRLNRDPRFRKTITHTVGDKSYTLEPDSPKYLFPIPIMVLDMNPDTMIPNIR